jgi:protein translocase SEC61 complex gamma subunit
MGLGKALSSTYRTLKLARKSDREEFMLYLKLVFIGFGIVGGLGFIIYFVASMIMLATGHSTGVTGQTTP